MTQEDVKKLLMIIAVTFPQFKIENAKETINAWYMLLEEYDNNEIMVAFKSYCKSSQSGFAPSVPQLIAELEKPQDLAVMDESEAWALVRKAIGRSTYNSQREFDKLPPTIQKAVGSPDILYSWATNEYYSDSKVMETFTFNYKNVCKRKREFEKLPAQLQAKVETFVERLPQLDNNTVLIGSVDYNEPVVESSVEGSNYTKRLEEKLGV